MNNEIKWKEIPSFPNYEASNTGLIRRAKNGKILKSRNLEDLDHRKYQIISIYHNKKKYTKKVARLVWEAFNQCECTETIDHIDKAVMNNNISNLRCVSKKMNSGFRDSYSNKTNKYNLNDDIKKEIISNYRSGRWTSWYVMKQFGIPTNYFHMIIKRGTWDRLIDG
jgi:hypothetical protein